MFKIQFKKHQSKQALLRSFKFDGLYRSASICITNFPQVNQNTEALKKNYLELTELKHILRKTQQFFDEQEQVSDSYFCGWLEKDPISDCFFKVIVVSSMLAYSLKNPK